MKKLKAFTLTEMLLVFLILSLLAIGGTRAVDLSNKIKRYQETLWRMERVRDHIIGDERILQSGMRFDFGYFGATGGNWPTSLEFLSAYWPWPDPYIYNYDAWATAYNVTNNASTYSVESYAADAANTGTGYNSDITFAIAKAAWDDNDTFIYCKDVKGTLLRGINHNSPGSADELHIQSVSLASNGATDVYDHTTQALTYSANGYWSHTSLNAGPFYITVMPGTGIGAQNSVNNWLPYLTSQTSPAVEIRGVIYPRGGYAANEINIIEVRLPGSVSEAGAPDIL